MLPPIKSVAQRHVSKGFEMIKTFMLILTTILLVSCATRYRPSNGKMGYSTLQIAPNTFTIHFAGNQFTSPERASDFALLRAAEVTLENDFKYFEVIDYKDFSKVDVNVSPISAETKTNYNTYGMAYGAGNTRTYNGDVDGKTTTEISGGGTNTTEEPRSIRTIKCYKANAKAKDSFFDAGTIRSSIRAKYELN